MTPARDPAAKVLERAELVRRYGRPRTDRVVFTNGCFELLHRGHVAYLASARELGEALVVGVNDDGSAGRLAKGPGRPFVSGPDRAFAVAALESVDAVCLFGEDTPRELVVELLPDVLVKGADYAVEDVAGAAEVRGAGGDVVTVPITAGYSTTELIARVRGRAHERAPR